MGKTARKEGDAYGVLCMGRLDQRGARKEEWGSSRKDFGPSYNNRHKVRACCEKEADEARQFCARKGCEIIEQKDGRFWGGQPRTRERCARKGEDVKAPRGIAE